MRLKTRSVRKRLNRHFKAISPDFLFLLTLKGGAEISVSREFGIL